MTGVIRLRALGARQLLVLALCLFGALAIAPAAASACTAGPYTECIPGTGNQSNGNGGTAGASTTNIPTSSSSESAGGGGGGGTSPTAKAAAAKRAKHTKQSKNAKQGKKGAAATPVSSQPPPSDSGGGGIPTIAWILIALAVLALIGGSIIVLRNRRDGADPAGPDPSPGAGATASPDSP